jgi:glycosyltransferase involved in cell wall biosynthesis
VELIPFADSELMSLIHQPGNQKAKALAMIRAFWRRVQQVARSSRYDAVFIHRAVCIAGPALLEQALAFFRRPVIFDFDDAIYHLHTTQANRTFGWLKFPGKTATICRLSAHVVVGNNYLADYARRYNPSVTVIPSSVDTERYHPVRRKQPDRRVVVGWTGSSTSQTHLEMFAPLLQKLAARGDVDIHVISDRRPDLPGVPVIWRPWSPETEIEDLVGFDIGIMPMPDDQWSRGKCAMKALLYMAMGIPAVCSAVGTNLEVIRHGENGFLASTQDEWLQCLDRLISDQSLRHQIGLAGRKAVENHYSMHRCAGLLAEVIRTTVDQHRPARIGEKLWNMRKLRSSAR